MYLDEINDILKTFNTAKLKLNGVKKINEFCLPEPRQGIILVRYKTKEFLIDSDGRIWDYKTFTDRKITNWQQFEYNENGDLILVKDYRRNRVKRGEEWECRLNKVIMDKVISERDRSGNLVESTFYLNGGLKTQKVRNASGCLTEEREYRSKVVVANKLFDEEGRVLKIHRFDTAGKPTTERNFEYDVSGNMIRYTYKGKDGKITTDRKLYYDIYNNLIEDVDIPKNVYDLLYAIDLDRLANEESNESYRHKYYYDCNQLLFEHQIYLAGQFGVAYEYDYEFADGFFTEKYPKN